MSGCYPTNYECKCLCHLHGTTNKLNCHCCKPYNFRHEIDELRKEIYKIKTLIDIKKIEQIILDGANLHATILKFENRMKQLEGFNKPHKCPVCSGNGKIYIDPAQFMSEIEAMFAKKDINGLNYEDCKICNGKGIVWG